MKLPKLKLSPLLIAVAGLIAVNVFLLFFLFKPAASQRPEMDWRAESYPEISAVKGSNWDFQQLTKYFKDIANDKGGAYAYHALSVAANEGYLTSNVDTHLLGHEVGNVLYKQQGINGIKVCTDDLRNACSHSIVVGFLIDNGEGSLMKAVETCEGAPGGLGAYTMCVHGLGHGVLGYAEYDMRKAVDMCMRTGTEKHHNQEIGQCIGGASMEMMAGVHDREQWLAQKPNYFNEKDPLAPCNMGFIPKEGLHFCYIYLTPHLFQAAGADLGSPDPKYFGKAMSYCSALSKDDPMRSVCFGSFGKEYIVLVNARNVQSVEHMDNEKLKTVFDWCALGPKEAVSPCIETALHSLYWGGENDPDVSIRFCGVVPVKDIRENCMQALIRDVSFYMKDNRTYKESFCNDLPSEYQATCREKLL